MSIQDILDVIENFFAFITGILEALRIIEPAPKTDGNTTGAE